MAEFAGISEQAMRKWMAEPDFPRASDGTVCLWDMVLWRERIDQNRNGPGGEDQAMEGGDSPWLEEYRKYRALQEKIDYHEKLKQSIPVREVHSFLGIWTSTWRSIAEQLQRAFGNDAAEIIKNGLRELHEAVLARWPDHDRDDFDNPDAPADNG